MRFCDGGIVGCSCIIDQKWGDWDKCNNALIAPSIASWIWAIFFGFCHSVIGELSASDVVSEGSKMNESHCRVETIFRPQYLIWDEKSVHRWVPTWQRKHNINSLISVLCVSKAIYLNLVAPPIVFNQILFFGVWFFFCWSKNICWWSLRVPLFFIHRLNFI